MSNEKSAQRRRKHCALAVVRRSQKISPRRRTPFQGRGTAKIQLAGDGHYLYLQTQFGEDRCMQFRVIVVTDPHTQRQDRLQYTAPQLARCKHIVTLKSGQRSHMFGQSCTIQKIGYGFLLVFYSNFVPFETLDM